MHAQNQMKLFFLQQPSSSDKRRENTLPVHYNLSQEAMLSQTKPVCVEGKARSYTYDKELCHATFDNGIICNGLSECCYIKINCNVSMLLLCDDAHVLPSENKKKLMGFNSHCT